MGDIWCAMIAGRKIERPEIKYAGAIERGARQQPRSEEDLCSRSSKHHAQVPLEAVTSERSPDLQSAIRSDIQMMRARLIDVNVAHSSLSY